jgi:hypothetical protein
MDGSLRGLFRPSRRLMALIGKWCLRDVSYHDIRSSARSIASLLDIAA